MKVVPNYLYKQNNYKFKKIKNMTTEELKNLAIAKSIDARGTACRGPLLEAKKAIGTVKAGDILEILSADEGTKSDIPKWCNKQGHEYLGAIDENGYFKVYMKKK